MRPDPVRDRNRVAVAQSVNNRSDPGQVVTARTDPVPPTMTPRRLRDHRRAAGVVGVRPLLAQLTKLNYSATAVIVSHPAWDLCSGDRRNKHDEADCSRWSHRAIMQQPQPDHVPHILGPDPHSGTADSTAPR